MRISDWSSDVCSSDLYFDESIDQTSDLTTGTNMRLFFDLLAGAGTPGTLGFVEASLGLPNGSIFSAGPLTAEAFSMDNDAISIFGTVDFEPTENRKSVE